MKMRVVNGATGGWDKKEMIVGGGVKGKQPQFIWVDFLLKSTNLGCAYTWGGRAGLVDPAL
jgi:hypothetical protein